MKIHAQKYKPNTNEEISRISLDSFEGSTGCFAYQGLAGAINQPTIKAGAENGDSTSIFLLNPSPKATASPPSLVDLQSPGY